MQQEQKIRRPIYIRDKVECFQNIWTKNIRFWEYLAESLKNEEYNFHMYLLSYVC
jgi:hypothetical protein